MRPPPWTALALIVLVAVAGAAAALWSLRGRLGPEPAPVERPDVLLVTVDTLRADHVGVYGGGRDVTPTIDALARDGAWLADADAPAPSTMASHASLFTSVYPHRHGVHRNGYVLPDGAETLAERLTAAGYDTAAFVSSFAVVSDTGIGQGFATFDDQGLEHRGGYHIEQRADATNARVLAWFDARGASTRPWFAWVHYFDPHYPYQPPEEFALRFAPGDDLGVDGSMEDVTRERRRFRRTGEPSAEGARLARLYRGEVAYVDRQLGALLEALRARSALGRAVVVVTSDHGETFDEHRFGAFDHGQNVYRTNVHVPLVWSGPGLSASTGRVDGPASLLDVAPTVLEMTGAEPLPRPDGISLLAALRGDAALDADRRLFAEATRGRGRGPSRGGWPNARLSRAVREGPLRLVVRARGVKRVEELYDLARDPLEARDLAGSADLSERELELRRALQDWDRTQSEFATAAPMGDLETLERLKALGYVDDAAAVAASQAATPGSQAAAGGPAAGGPDEGVDEDEEEDGGD